MVCSNCALVLIQNISNDQVNFIEETNASNSMTDYITECCYRMHISSGNIMESIQQNFKTARTKKCFQKSSNEQLSAYIIQGGKKVLDTVAN